MPELDGALVCDESSLRWAAEDFGHVVHHRSRAVLRPGKATDVAFAGKIGLTVAARGAGHATHGQAQAAGGIVIDMAGLSLVSEVRAGRVTAQGGALWSEVVDAALAHGCTPPVLTDYLDLSVGGTLAVGGVGGTSHRYGLQVDGVDELTVVTGTGALVTCSAERHQRLFDAVRAGLGQCGLVISATISAVAAPARARRYRLHYRDLATFLTDQRYLVTQNRFDFLQGQILPAALGGWRYLLEAAAYYTPPVAPDAALLNGLRYDSADVETDDISYREFVHRMALGEAALRASGEWLRPHAWITVFLPSGATVALVEEILDGLTPAELGDSGLVLLYPINSVPMSPADWRVHFGPRWRQLQSAKEEFDPHGVLTPGYGLGVTSPRGEP